MNIENIHSVAILGAGESGTGAALLAKAKGMDVFVSDAGTISSKFAVELDNHEISYESGSHTVETLLSKDLVIKSPGIDGNIALLEKIRGKKIPVIGEIEFASLFYTGKIIGITGSNGKSTTTVLSHYILKNAGINAAIGGNIGVSFSRLLVNNTPDVVVLELSSFQLENIMYFKPDIAVFLNFSSDHLERYKDEKMLYFNAKWLITENQTADDVLIYNMDDYWIDNAVRERQPSAEKIPFSMKKPLEKGAYILKNKMTIKLNEQNQFEMNAEEIALKGSHNQQNSMAASVIARLLEVRKDTIRESLQGFNSLEHRLEVIATIRGVEFINDSKATNVNAVWYALESMNKPVIWIAGGIDKGNDYDLLEDLVEEKVKALIPLGEDNEMLINAFKGKIRIEDETHSMQAAIESAFRIAESGDVVLLSPACSSFDLFENFMDRGNQFKSIVKAL